MSKIAKKRPPIVGLSRSAAAHPRLATKATSSKDAKQRLDKISKQARVIAMLRSQDGTPIAAMMKLTGWQQHSIRGFLAGVVKNKLGLKLSSETNEGVRVYQILGDQNSSTDPSKGKRAR